MNLENESLFFFQKEGMISGTDHHLLTFFVMLMSRIHYVVCWHETFLTHRPFYNTRIPMAFLQLCTNKSFQLIQSFSIKYNYKYMSYLDTKSFFRSFANLHLKNCIFNYNIFDRKNIKIYFPLTFSVRAVKEETALLTFCHIRTHKPLKRKLITLNNDLCI